mgnify:CR=1
NDADGNPDPNHANRTITGLQTLPITIADSITLAEARTIDGYTSGVITGPIDTGAIAGFIQQTVAGTYDL